MLVRVPCRFFFATCHLSHSAALFPLPSSASPCCCMHPLLRCSSHSIPLLVASRPHSALVQQRREMSRSDALSSAQLSSQHMLQCNAPSTGGGASPRYAAVVSSQVVRGTCLAHSLCLRCSFSLSVYRQSRSCWLPQRSTIASRHCELHPHRRALLQPLAVVMQPPPLRPPPLSCRQRCRCSISIFWRQRPTQEECMCRMQNAY